MSTSTGSARFKWPYVGVGLLALWIGFRTWDYYGRPLTEADLKTASPDRLAQGLSNPGMRDRVAAKLLDGGPSGWKALVRAIRSPNRDARLVSALTLAKLRVLSLEAGIASSVEDKDPEVATAKIAALAANGSRAVLQTCVKWLQVSSNVKIGEARSLALRRVCMLFASINTPEARQALEPLVQAGEPDAIKAIGRFHTPLSDRLYTDAVARLGSKQRLSLIQTWDHQETRQQVCVELVDAVKRSDKQTINDILESVPDSAFDSPELGPQLISSLARLDPQRAVAKCIGQPNEATGLTMARIAAESADPAEIRKFTLLARLNGAGAQLPFQVNTDSASILSAVAVRDRAALPVAREVLRGQTSALDARDAAVLLLVSLPENQDDVKLAADDLSKPARIWTPTSIHAFILTGDGPQKLIDISKRSDTTQDMLELMVKTVSRGLHDGLTAVQLAKNLEWQRIAALCPTQCAQFGDDELKEKYALLLGNNLYEGRIAKLQLFGKCGHPKLLDELKLTAGRGLLDEVIACIQIAGRTQIDGAEEFVKKYADDKRDEVRDAAKAAMALIHPEMGK